MIKKLEPWRKRSNNRLIGFELPLNPAEIKLNEVIEILNQHLNPKSVFDCANGKHDKCYSIISVDTLIPNSSRKSSWICRICGEKGTETLAVYEIDIYEYDKLVKKFEEEK